MEGSDLSEVAIPHPHFPNTCDSPKIKERDVTIF